MGTFWNRPERRATTRAPGRVYTNGPPRHGIPRLCPVRRHLRLDGRATHKKRYGVTLLPRPSTAILPSKRPPNLYWPGGAVITAATAAPLWKPSAVRRPNVRGGA